MMKNQRSAPIHGRAIEYGLWVVLYAIVAAQAGIATLFSDTLYAYSASIWIIAPLGCCLAVRGMVLRKDESHSAMVKVLLACAVALCLCIALGSVIWCLYAKSVHGYPLISF